MRNDRLSALGQWDLDGPAAIANEVAWGGKTLASGEAYAGSARAWGARARFDRARETLDLFGFAGGKGHGLGPRRSRR